MQHRFDIEDAGFISHPPDDVFAALLSFVAGDAQWWRPYVRIRGMGNPGSLSRGVQYWILVLLGRPRMLVEVVTIKSGRRFKVKVVDGDYTGFIDWSFAPQGNGTELVVRWRANPNGWLGWLGLFMGGGAIHSWVMRAGFRALEAHLKQVNRHIDT